jgi:hypothetical protein
MMVANLSWTNGTVINGAWLNVTNSSNLFPQVLNLPSAATGLTPLFILTQFSGNNTFNVTSNPFNFTANGTSSLGPNLNSTLYNITVGQTLLILITNDSFPPQWQFNSTNGTRAATNVTFSLNWTDKEQLSSYIFSYDNGNGTFYNNSDVPFNGVSNWSNVSEFINVTGGSLVRWQMYVNDTANNWNNSPIFYINRTYNPIGGSDQYAGLIGRVTWNLNTSSNYQLLGAFTKGAAQIYVMPATASPAWTLIRAATLGTDMPAMDAVLGLTASKDLLESNYNMSIGSICGLTGVNEMNSSDRGFQIGLLYSDTGNNGHYVSGDPIIFCTQVNSSVTSYNGTLADYEVAFPEALGASYNIYLQ